MAASKPGVATHYQRYAIGNVMTIMAGLISFPILTRMLDNTQYGILGYTDTWVLMAVAVGKLGAQHAILRFYPHGGDEARLRAFSTNLFYLPLLISACIWALAALVLAAVDLTGGFHQSPVFWMALVLAALTVYASLVETVLRATENSGFVILTRVAWRWLELLLMIGAVLLLQHSALAAYGGKLAAALLMVGIYVRWSRRHLAFSRPALDLGQLREGLVYGLPLVANEMIAVALVSVDRLMIKNIMGDFAAVGVYTIGASLAMQVSVFLNIAVFEAFTPMANRLYDTEGAAAVRALKQRVLLPLTYAAVGAAVLLWCFGTDVIVALSGPSKAGSGPVFSWMGIIYALQPLLLVAGYGLLLEKRSVKVMTLMGMALAVNTLCNLFWIPRFGVMGAVYATALSSALVGLGHCLWVPRNLLQLPAARTLLVAGGVGLAVCIGMTYLDLLLELRQGWVRLLGGGGLVGITYLLAVLVLDPRLREVLWQLLLPRLPARFRKTP